MFKPNFQITPSLTKTLMDIEASRQAVSELPMTVSVITSLFESARLTSTHYSTQIEGNRLTQEQVEQVVHGGSFPNHERDEQEVKCYYQALEYVDTLIEVKTHKVREKEIQTIHGLVFNGKEQATPYRDGQNVIRGSGSNAIVYMPPEAKDVPTLMKEFIIWINEEITNTELPTPIIAAITHYQFATIHPYYDGNGRTARLLTNLVLHKLGYGLKGIYSLEEYYARDLQAYYSGLSIGDSHNYYFGRENSDITSWISYFCEGMADAFAKVRITVSEAAKETKTDHSLLLRELDQRQKQVLSLFSKSRFITTKEIANLLGIHPRTALNLCKKWVKAGFIIQHGDANKSRHYELAEKWSQLICS